MSPFERRGDRIRATRQQFLWHRRIPLGHITALGGGPSKGKSTLGYLAAKEADVPTIFVTSEEVDETVWKPRIVAAGLDLKKAFHHREVKFSRNPKDIGYLRGLIETYDAKLVVVDPLTNHLRDASISHDQSIRTTFESYEETLHHLKVGLVLQVHVLHSITKNMHPLNAIPAGLRSVAKAVYLFADDPTIGADPNMRVLACAGKYNFGEQPPSALFEFSTRNVRVFDEETGRYEQDSFGIWIPRGTTNVSAKTLLISLRPEDKERKADVAAHLLLKFLAEGPKPVTEIRKAMADRDPPISWRTVERIFDEMGIVVEDDPNDKRRKIWSLPPDALAAIEEADDVDQLQIDEIEIPDAPPEDWNRDSDSGGDGEDDGEEEDA